MKSQRAKALFAGLLSIQLIAATASAVHIYDGVRAPKGLYLLTYSTLYYARDLADANGDAAIEDLDLVSAQQLVRLAWYTPNVMLTAIVPAGYIESSHFGQSDSGLGDVLFGGGAFLPIKSADVLCMAVASAPTGDNEAGKNINEGSGQWNYRPSVFVHKTVEPYTFDTVVKYNFRQENDDTGSRPGDELYVEAMATRKFGSVRIGPNIGLLRGKDTRIDGVGQPDSGKRRVAAGIEAYMRVAGLGMTLNYMADVYAENSARGHLFMVKFVKKLW